MMHGHSKYTPRVVALEMTRSCNLNCKHCRAGAENRAYANELSTDEWKKILLDLSEMSKAVVIMTGGEPMLRDDLYELATYGDSLGLRMVMAPCGPKLNKDSVKEILDAKIMKISVSLDSSDSKSHDDFRGVPGIMDQTLKGIEAAREGGLPFQVNSTITKHNIAELEDIYNMAIDLGAENWDVFLLVPTGRGKALLDAELTATEYEDALNWLYEKQQNSKIPIKLTCAPHYHRIRVEKGDEFRKFKACMGGETFGFVSHVGQVQICGFLDIPCGDARKEGFKTVWENSTVLKEIRDLDGYKGKCNGCSYLTICGGCRARAYGVTGDYLESEPFCTYEEK